MGPPRQAPYSAKDSRAFQSSGRSMARTDWVRVGSSTFSARAVIHSAKRQWPARVKAQAKGLSKPCQIDQSRVTSVLGASPYGPGWGGCYPSRSARTMPGSIDDGCPLRVEGFGETTD